MRELAAIVLDLLGGLLLVAAAALWASRVDPSLGLAVAGAGLLTTSWLGERAGTWRPRWRAHVARVRARRAARKAGGER